MSRWLEFLTAYSYTLAYRPGKALSNADGLSRCPLPVPLVDPAPVSEVLLIEELGPPISASDIAAHSAKDPVLQQVLDWVRRGWPLGRLDPQYLPFQHRQVELSTLQGCLLWGNRVVAPPSLYRPILQRLHESHPGIVRMKALGRSYVWWPGMDQAIEKWVSQCQACQASRPAPPRACPRSWETPRGPWSRVHLDFAGPYYGHQFLVVVDAYSGWVDLELMPSTTADTLVRTLMKLFATHGFPDVVVSDNGPQFASTRFQLFLASHGIRQALTAPWHPASNGRAERAVRSAKEALARLETPNWQDRVSLFLLAQHSTPCPTSNRSPAELLMGRRLRTDLDRMHPRYSSEGPLAQQVGGRRFAEGDAVYAQNFGGEPRWLPGHISGVTGPCSYRVNLEDGRTWRRHIDQLRGRLQRDDISPPVITRPETPPRPTSHPVAGSPLSTTLPADATTPLADAPLRPSATVSVPTPAPSSNTSSSTSPLPETPQQEVPAVPRELRHSSRLRTRPAYLDDYVCACQEGRGVMSS